jgi:hypothetical protein
VASLWSVWSDRAVTVTATFDDSTEIQTSSPFFHFSEEEEKKEISGKEIKKSNWCTREGSS